MTRTAPARLLVAAVALVAVLLPTSPAWAHAQLVAAVPAQNATLEAAPTAVTLTFNENLNPDFTTIALSDSTRRRLPAGVPVVAGPRGTMQLTGPVGNGAYTVAYRVVSTDGHTVQGSYGFVVADPALPAAPDRSPVAATATGHSGGAMTATLVGLGLGLVGVAVVVFLVSRRRRVA